MAGIRSKPRKSGRYQGWFFDHKDKRTYFDGTTSRRDTLRAAQKMEAYHRDIKLGVTPAPETKRKRERLVKNVINEYISWGKSRGRKDGRAWSDIHARKTESTLIQLTHCLELKRLNDCEDILPAVDALAARMVAEKQSPKTVANRLGALRAWLRWCVSRNFLAKDPLTNLGKLDTTPTRIQRRVLSLEEISRLLAVAPEHRRLLYLVAMTTGLRAGELRHITQNDIDRENNGIHLRATWTKNRKQGYLPLPKAMVDALLEFSKGARPAYMYERYRSQQEVPGNVLLFVPSHTARTLDADRRKASIAKQTHEGIVDFHCLRNTFITLVTEQQATVKEAQSLARHSDPRLTIGVYARSRSQRETQIVNAVFDRLCPLECAHGVPDKQRNRKALKDASKTQIIGVGACSSNPPASSYRTVTLGPHKPNKTLV